MQPLSWRLSEQAGQGSLEHALGKIILPTQTSALRGREARVSAAYCRTEAASFTGRLLASADRFPRWSFDDNYHSLVHGTLIKCSAWSQMKFARASQLVTMC
jgi:hypothetical protein